MRKRLPKREAKTTISMLTKTNLSQKHIERSLPNERDKWN